MKPKYSQNLEEKGKPRRLFSFDMNLSNQPIKFKNPIKSLKIHKLSLNDLASIDRTSIFEKQKSKNIPKVKTSTLSCCLQERIKTYSFSKRIEPPNNSLNNRNFGLINIKKSGFLSVLPIITQDNDNKKNNDKNNSTNKRLKSAINQNKNLEKKIIKSKLKHKSKIPFSNDLISDTISKKKIKYRNKRSYNSFTQKEIELLDNPNSVLYQIFHGTQLIKQKIGKFDIYKKKEQMKEYKDFIKNDEKEAAKQLFLLQKDIEIGSQEKIKGRIISSNTFFDLKISID